VTNPISTIVRNIQKIKKGEYDLSQVKDAGPEFAVLGDAFDNMASSIRQNINSIETNARLRRQLLEAENENLRMNELLINSELKILQAQMNPHFLFNTLSMISQIASMGRSEEAARLTDITTNLLRYSMDKSNRMSTLKEEIECAENYISIQRLRLGERITFEMNIEDNLPDIMLPGMLLQPLIENACVHGVSEMLKGALVTVTASSRKNELYIAVEDNGKGMSAERLEEISLLHENGERSHIGLVNARKRIELLYGSSASFHIESTEDVGTLISITIKKDGEHV
jgi:sensor histidine kinase YesM